MGMACDPQGKCPQCGYPNVPGVARCVRCRGMLHLPAGCTGACSKCLLPQTFLPETPSTIKKE